MGCFVYFLLGSTMEMNIGPTAIMALMTYQYSGQGVAAYAVLLCFMSGIIELAAGILNLGKVMFGSVRCVDQAAGVLCVQRVRGRLSRSVCWSVCCCCVSVWQETHTTGDKA